MKENGHDRRVRRTKKMLTKGFAQLMNEKNIKDISVRELTDLVDLNRGTFYLHYRDIYDLQEHLENEIIAEVTGIFDSCKPAKYGDGPLMIFQSLLEYFYENSELCQALTCPNANRTFIDKLSRILQDQCLHMWMDEFGMERNKKEMEYFGAFIIAGYMAGISKWAEDGMKEPPQEIAGLLSRIGVYGTRFLQKETP